MTFECSWDGCRSAFRESREFDLHEKRPHHKCEAEGCGKVFVRTSGLDTHVKAVHEGRREHRCEVGGCGKAFGERVQLAGHTKFVHDGRRDHRCEEDGCGKAFVRRAGLRRHVENIHLKQRDHRCEVDGCGKAFEQRAGLRFHTKSVHLERRDKRCAVPGCGKVYARSYTLKNHVKNVHGKRRDWSDEVGCAAASGFSFNDSGSLTKHTEIGDAEALATVSESTTAEAGAAEEIATEAAGAEAFSAEAIVVEAAESAVLSLFPALASVNTAGAWDASDVAAPSVASVAVAAPAQVFPALNPASGPEELVLAETLPPVPAPSPSPAPAQSPSPAPGRVPGALLGRKRTRGDSPACTQLEPSLEAAPGIVRSKRARVSVTDGGTGGTPGAGSWAIVNEEVLRRVREVIDAARGVDGKFNVDEVVALLSGEVGCGDTRANPLTLAEINLGIIDMIRRDLIVPSHILRSDIPTF